MAPEEILSSADAGRRDFLKKVLVGTTFAAPVIASFSMEGLSPESVEAGFVSNQCGNQTQILSPCCQLAVEITAQIIRLELQILQFTSIEDAKRLIDKLDKAKAAMIEGMVKGEGLCNNDKSKAEFKKAAKELGKFEDLAAELCAAANLDPKLLIIEADFIIDRITLLVEEECNC